MYLKLTNDIPAKYTLGQLRRDNANVSFPKLIPDDLLATYDVYPYTRPDVPDYDSTVNRVVEGAFEQVNGNWVLPYVVEQLPQDQAEANVRGKRDMLLQETDWMALTDNTMTEAMASYRQALRDITAQEGFPYTVTWAIKPE